jgi:uncharacterized protein
MRHVLADALATALVVGLVVVQPIRGRQRYQLLVALVQHDAGARRRFYRRGIAAEWVGVAVVLVIGILGRRSWSSIRLDVVHLSGGQLLEVAVAVLVSIGVLVGTRAIARSADPAILDRIHRQAHGFAAMLPHSQAERRSFVWLSLTAGICEEVLFRGFGIAYLSSIDHHANTALLVAAVAVAFGAGHAYQGVRGFVLTGILGAILAWLTIATGTLLPAIVLHVAIDVRVIPLSRALYPVTPAEP